MTVRTFTTDKARNRKPESDREEQIAQQLGCRETEFEEGIRRAARKARPFSDEETPCRRPR